MLPGGGQILPISDCRIVSKWTSAPLLYVPVDKGQR
jgi:hypothetical protein